MATVTATATLLSSNLRQAALKSQVLLRRSETVGFNRKAWELRKTDVNTSVACPASRRSYTASDSELDDNTRKILQSGDPVWAITSDTINSLVGLSLNFFFILPLINSAGIHLLIDAPVLHPMSEGLFNFVIGWTLMFAPLLFTDRNRDRYKGSLDVLWGFQMFLTNTFLIPYMAIRLNKPDHPDYTPKKASQLGSIMVNGAPVVGLIGGAACFVSILWAFFGRLDQNFGSIADRWEFLVSYLGSERLAYAFIWDICLYMVFQPWLIGENLQNVKERKVNLVKYLRFVPVLGLVAYLLCLDVDEEKTRALFLQALRFMVSSASCSFIPSFVFFAAFTLISHPLSTSAIEWCFSTFRKKQLNLSILAEDEFPYKTGSQKVSCMIPHA
ncbi:hypothetical protein E3N88_45795 [Mikania micrantha]|uniref:Uncharacterized protein n=1 Tax=Mikania micrantha TaxID=192012 RepID=A0A5N6LAF9_9ASTR|nr:hypothetical protein E3N88_45795 [Mikania micrantha]